jgi:Ca-activated chloride channel homolog
MRKPLFILGVVLFGAAACSSSSDQEPAGASVDNGTVGTGGGGGSSGASGSSATVVGTTGGTMGTTAGAGGGASGMSGAGGGGTYYGAGGSTGTSGSTGMGGAGVAMGGSSGAVWTVSDAGVAQPGVGGAGGAGGATSVTDDAGVADDAATNDVLVPDALAPDVDSCLGLNRDMPVVLYQSSDDSNSMASPAIARRLINLGQRVPAGIVRTYEFLNYYKVAYEAAPASRVRVVPQMRPAKKPGEYTLQIGIQSEAAPVKRRPMNITFVLDCSGSMSGNPIAIEREAVKAIAGVMQAGDRVSMVTWNTEQNTVLEGHVVDGPNDADVVGAANALQADGSTDLSSGLNRGYALAQQYYSKDLLNRVVLISDGVANVGLVDEQLIGNASHSQDQEGVYLVGVSVGDGINDTLMNVVTDKGRGAYVYLDSADEAVKMLNRRFDETMEIAARGVRLELTLPWYFAMKTFSGEQSSTVASEVDPQHLAPDDAMVFNETFAPCDPALVKPTDTIGAKATYETPIVHEAREDGVTATIGDLLAASDAQLKKGSAIVAYAEALKVATTVTPLVAREKLAAALEMAQAANPNGTDPELAEIAKLIISYMTRF